MKEISTETFLGDPRVDIRKPTRRSPAQKGDLIGKQMTRVSRHPTSVARTPRRRPEQPRARPDLPYGSVHIRNWPQQVRVIQQHRRVDPFPPSGYQRSTCRQLSVLRSLCAVSLEERSAATASNLAEYNWRGERQSRELDPTPQVL